MEKKQTKTFEITTKLSFNGVVNNRNWFVVD